MQKVNLREKLAKISTHWDPKIVAEVGGMQVRLAKVKGEFEWHHHPEEDELFWVLKGRLLLQLRDADVWLEEGELAVVPRGVEHRPVAAEEVELALLEPAETRNTRNVVNECTRTRLDWI